MRGVDEVRQLDATRTHWVTTVTGVTREFDAEVTEQDSDKRVAWTSMDGPTPRGRHHLSSAR
jgi:uncharacterized membrane protein